MDYAIKASNLSHIYGIGTPFEKCAISHLNFYAEQGEFVAVIGGSGSGKSTLIQHFNGLLRPSTGDVFINGENIFKKNYNIQALRFSVGIVFQYPERQLFAETVFDDIAFGLRNMQVPKKELNERVEEVVELLAIPPELLSKSPFEISVGQQRRVALAGVLAMKPKILLLDEPCSGLDPAGTRMVLNKISEYKRINNATVVWVTHNMEEACATATRIVVMEKGSIVLSGSKDEIFSNTAKIERLNLSLPDITSVAISLKNRGVNIDGDIYSVAHVAKAISDVYKNFKKGGENQDVR